MFLCKMNKGISNFKNVFDLYGQIGIVDVCFDIKKGGIYIYTTYDKSIHTMATFSSTSFLDYKCEKECIFTLNIKSMKENLKNITSVDTIELSIKKERELRIKVTKKTIEFEKKIHMKETQFYDLPIVLEQVQPLNIKSSDFLEFCRSISGKYVMTIKTDDGIPEIAFESDKSKVIIKSDNDNYDSILPFEGEFKAEYFSKLKKFTKFNTLLKVYTNPSQPLIFESNIGTKDKDKITIWIKSLKQMEEDYEEQDQE
ncbi:Proliferating cell nuclear antigen [Invertebrate iridovirus 25]|uniref:Proliferating cell nuclear antigen n=1 Tax=Invertebrate iridovirus 25 TaxID=1301280 RepID=W8W1L3_9VIRU|nr:Proliferating cell nuclear antigen [Invertebrate iridovirus 25]CCV02138.1 Proliferating cell nuclear antigen [Invertebrate iridovirus 25]